MANANTSDVLIVGGGILGLSIAEACGRAGLQVTLFDRGTFGGGATNAAAGMIPAAHDRPDSEPYERLKGRGSDLFPELSQRLAETTGIDNGFRPCGGIELAPDHAEAAALRDESETWTRQGVAWRELGVAGLRELAPAVEGAVETAYLLESYAVFEPERHVEALAVACTQLKTRLVSDCRVTQLERVGDRVEGVVTDDGRRWHAQTTLVAAGSWSQALLAPLGISLDTRPMRGQIVCLQPSRPVLDRVVMWGRRYLVPRAGGRLILGSTEEDVGFDTRCTAGAVQEMLDQALAFVPSLATAPIESTWAGLRPGSLDGLPSLGPVSGVEGLQVAVGHYRLGLMMSASTAELMARSILGQDPTIPLDAFDPGRSGVQVPTV